MKPLTRYEIRLNLIDLVSEQVRGAYSEPSPPDEGQDALLKLLNIYRADTVRKMHGERGDRDYLWGSLRVGVRLAGSLMQGIQEHEYESLAGWYLGKQPANKVQLLYNLVSETALELSVSIMEVESRYPEDKWMFDRERADYARIHAQWQKEDEHEQTTC